MQILLKNRKEIESRYTRNSTADISCLISVHLHLISLLSDKQGVKAAKTIAAIYKERWQIDLFFKWIKAGYLIGRRARSDLQTVSVFASRTGSCT